jgi:Na+/glutamate symporter
MAFLSLPFSTCAACFQTSSRFRADNAVGAAVQTATGVLAVDPLLGIIKTSIGITDGHLAARACNEGVAEPAGRRGLARSAAGAPRRQMGAATAIRPRTAAQVTGCWGVGGPRDGRRT